MNVSLVEVLVAPECYHPLTLESHEIDAVDSGGNGALVDVICRRRFSLHAEIPRFVSDDGYATSFGEQWNRFQRTQIDRFSGTTLSRDRFYHGTGWTPDELSGQRVLEAGCGAGRFTQVMLDAGAQVYAFDLSRAVDACWANNGPHPKLCVVQADIYTPPFQPGSFDKIFCYGVLQHTPDPMKAFRSLLRFLKPGGEIVVDVYRKTWALRPWNTKYFYRPLTTRISRDRLWRIIEWYIPKWVPIDTQLKRIPKLSSLVGLVIPCWNYSAFPLTRTQVMEWAVLDAFDALSATYDVPQTFKSVQRWFEEAGLVNVRIREEGAWVLANGCKPIPQTAQHAASH